MQIIPDGIIKEFKLPTIAKEVHSVQKYNKKTDSYVALKFEFNKFSNTVIFEEAPEKGCCLMINSTQFIG